jgi:hypothetical protein
MVQDLVNSSEHLLMDIVVFAAVEDGDEQREPSSGGTPLRIHPHHMVMVGAAFSPTERLSLH